LCLGPPRSKQMGHHRIRPALHRPHKERPP
jgi:hypothetical protein